MLSAVTLVNAIARQVYANATLGTKEEHVTAQFVQTVAVATAHVNTKANLHAITMMQLMVMAQLLCTQRLGMPRRSTAANARDRKSVV